MVILNWKTWFIISLGTFSPLILPNQLLILIRYPSNLLFTILQPQNNITFKWTQVRQNMQKIEFFKLPNKWNQFFNLIYYYFLVYYGNLLPSRQRAVCELVWLLIVIFTKQYYNNLSNFVGSFTIIVPFWVCETNFYIFILENFKFIILILQY